MASVFRHDRHVMAFIYGTWLCPLTGKEYIDWRYIPNMPNGVKATDQVSYWHRVHPIQNVEYLTMPRPVWTCVVDSDTSLTMLFRFNSLMTSEAYMHQYNISTLAQIMAGRLFCANPSSETLLPYWQLNPKKYISVIFVFTPGNHLKMSSAKWWPCFSASMC